MKKVLSIVIVFVIVISLMIPVFADSTATEELAEYGVIAGDGNDYNEMGVLTRAQFTVLLSQLYGLKDAAGDYVFDSSFTDLVEGEWYYPYVAFAETRGWMSGMGDGTFAPNEPMTVQQVNSMYVRSLGYDVPWDDANIKAQELGVYVVASNPNQVVRGEAFKALRAALDVVPNGSTYTLGTNLGLVGYESSIEGSPVVVPSGEIGVASIEAINLRQIEVVFSSVINETGDESNYSIETTGTAVLDSSSNFSLQEDGKTVIITLSEVAKQQEQVTFKIRNMYEISESKSIKFIDLEVPTVLNAKGVSLSTVSINFSEPMSTGLTTKSNYSIKSSKGKTLYIKSITAGKNNESVLLEFYSSLVGEEVVTIKDIKDYQGFKVVSVEAIVEMDIDSDPPVVVSYRNADQNSVTLVFDSNIEVFDASLSNYYCSNSSNIATDISIDENELTIEFSNTVPSGTTYVYVDKSSIQDMWGNKNSKISEKVTIVIDESEPKMVGALEVISQSSVEINFDQAVNEMGENFKVLLYAENGDVVDFKAYTTVINEKLEITFSEDLFGTYTLDLKGVEDENKNQAGDLSIEFKVVDETSPDIDDFEALLYDGTTQLIRIDFKEDMDIDTIGDKAYYYYGNKSLDDDEVTLKVISDNTVVELEIPSDFINVSKGQDITIGRVADSSGNLMNGIYGDLELLDGNNVKLEIKSVEIINENTVILTLLNDIIAGIDEDKFSFNSDLTIYQAYPSINDASESIITFITKEDIDTGDTIKLTVSAGAGENNYGQQLETGTFTAKDTASPIVQKFDYISSVKIKIEFNEPLNSNTFAVAGHNGFSVSGGNAELTSVSYSASQLTINGTGFTKDTNIYYNSIFGITDTDGNSLEDFTKTSELD